MQQKEKTMENLTTERPDRQSLETGTMQQETTRLEKYNSQKAMQQYAAAILQKLPMIDRVQTVEEMNGMINEMLSLLGKCSGADRVYLFDRDREKDTYTRKYEWCAPGIPSKHDFLKSVTGDEAPEWRKVFEKGEIVVIPDVEVVKESMPLEYAILKRAAFIPR